MLILERRTDEVIRIGDDIRVVIVSVRDGGKVRVGIDAPRHLPVHRQEVWEAIQREKETDLQRH